MYHKVSISKKKKKKSIKLLLLGIAPKSKSRIQSVLNSLNGVIVRMLITVQRIT